MTKTVQELQDTALWVRRKVLEMAVAADSGHVSTAMSQTEILVALYFGGVLRYDPTNPKWDGRDIFLLSKGQGGIGLYPVLAKAGFFPEADLNNFCGPGSHIGVHAEWHCPGIEMISGSLGHGLPVATGIAAALKADGKDNLVFVLVGDGELHEGSNWEAIMTAAHQGLSNLVVIVDRNGQNTIGRTRPPMDGPKDGPGLGDLRGKFEAFGFQVNGVDGHDFTPVLGVLSQARSRCDYGLTKPLCVICNTKKGKGLSAIEDRRDWHYRVPRDIELDQCRADLGLPLTTEMKLKCGQAKHAIAMRDRFFDALLPHFKRDKSLVLITADNGWPGIDQFAALKGQFYQVGIAEQEMTGMAAGLALAGRKVWCYAIAPFVTTRVHEFVKLDVCAMNLPVCMVGVGAGFAYDIMGPTHHCVEDIAIMRALPNMRIFSPCDGHTAALVADVVAGRCQEWPHHGPSYVRLDRGGLPDLYNGPPYLTACQSDIKDGPYPCLFVSTGVMTHTAYKVRDVLGGRVLDVIQLKPLDTAIFAYLGGWERVVVLEEHQRDGGLGSIIAEVIADAGLRNRLLRVAVPNTFTFDLGGREVIHKKYGLDAASVVKRIQEWKRS